MLLIGTRTRPGETISTKMSLFYPVHVSYHRLIIGLSQFTHKAHIIRATLEGIAFETVDILSIMRRDCPVVNVDGGMSGNDLLCQTLADLTGCEIVRPSMIESTALGAAMVAGHALS